MFKSFKTAYINGLIFKKSNHLTVLNTFNKCSSNLKYFSRNKRGSGFDFNLPDEEEENHRSKSKPTLPEDSEPSLSKRKFNLLFFGNDEISLPTLYKIYEESFKDDSVVLKLAVVTTPLENKRSFQGIFHKFLAEKNIQKIELSIKTPEDLKASWRNLNNIIKENNFEIGIVASFGRMIPGSIITSLKHGAFVMHPSLLPKYRGAAPIQHALLNKEKVTGVSIVETSLNKFDAGDILIQKEIPVQVFHRFKELSTILSHTGAEMTLDFLKDFEKLQKTKTPQDESKATKAGLFLDNNSVYLDFVKMTTEEILTKYKAFYGSQLEPFTKGLIEGKERFFFFENLFNVTPNSEFYKLILMKVDKLAKAGDVYWDIKEDRNNIFLKCKDGWLVSSSLKFDGTPYTKAEMVISKIFRNKRFKTKENKDLEVKTLQNRNTIEKVKKENKILEQKVLDNKESKK